MAVLGFLVTSDLTALPGSGHTTTIGAQLVPIQHLFSASVRIVEEVKASLAMSVSCPQSLQHPLRMFLTSHPLWP